MSSTDSWSLVAELHAYPFADSLYGIDMHAALSPDGQRIVTTLYSTSFYDNPLDKFDIQPLVWDAESGALLHTLRHPEQTSHFALSPDGSQVITTSRDNQLRFWDIATGDLLKTRDIDEQTAGPNDVGLLIKRSDSRLEILDAETGNDIRVVRDGGPWRRYAISANAQTVVEGSIEGWLRYWNSADDRKELLGGGPIVTCVAVSADGRRIAAGTTVGAIRVWDADNGQIIDALNIPDRTIDDIAMTADGRLIVASLHNGPLKIWNIATGKTSKLPCYRRYSNHFGVSADGRRIVVGQSSGDIEIWTEPSAGHSLSTFNRLVRRLANFFRPAS